MGFMYHWEEYSGCDRWRPKLDFRRQYDGAVCSVQNEQKDAVDVVFAWL
jgi:hypothetical protein